MADYTTTLDTEALANGGAFPQWMRPAFLSVTANGGSVLIEARQGAGWVTIETITADTAKAMDVANGRFRFTPSGGATYTFTVDGV